MSEKKPPSSWTERAAKKDGEFLAVESVGSFSGVFPKNSKGRSNGGGDDGTNEGENAVAREEAAAAAVAVFGDPKTRVVYRDYSLAFREDEADRSAVVAAAASSILLPRRGSRDESFPAKLHRIISDAEAMGFGDCITWLAHGRSFRILSTTGLEACVLPKYFNSERIASFMRQVNGWGFRRVANGPSYGSYYHEFFLRGLPHLARKVHKPPAGEPRKNKKETNIIAAPDFDAISRLRPLPGVPKPAQGDQEEKKLSAPTAAAIMPSANVAKGAGDTVQQAHSGRTSFQSQSRTKDTNLLEEDALMSLLLQLLAQAQQQQQQQQTGQPPVQTLEHLQQVLQPHWQQVANLQLNQLRQLVQQLLLQQQHQPIQAAQQQMQLLRASQVQQCPLPLQPPAPNLAVRLQHKLAAELGLAVGSLPNAPPAAFSTAQSPVGVIQALAASLSQSPTGAISSLAGSPVSAASGTAAGDVAITKVISDLAAATAAQQQRLGEATPITSTVMQLQQQHQGEANQINSAIVQLLACLGQQQQPQPFVADAVPSILGPSGGRGSAATCAGMGGVSSLGQQLVGGVDHDFASARVQVDLQGALQSLLQQQQQQGGAPSAAGGQGVPSVHGGMN